MKISNDAQFRQYFYLYLLDFPELNNNFLEEKLKEYLMYKGIFCLSRSPQGGVGVPVKVRDFDELLCYFNKYGQI